MADPRPTGALEPAAPSSERSTRVQAVLAQRLKARAAGPPAADSIPPLADHARVPLSFAQERLWLIDQLDPGSAAYNIPVALVLRGPLDAAALAAALDEVVRRHGSLRTVFAATSGGGAFQRVLPYAPAPLSRIDLAGLPDDRRAAAARALAGAEARRPFDLERGPLLRRTLVRLGPEEHLLLLTLHHIVSDGWSQGLLTGELTALYAVLAEDRPAADAGLPDLPIQYADFAAWQRERLAGEVLEREVAFWRRAMAGAPAVLELPADRPRPALPALRGGRRIATLPPELTADLRALAQAEGATLFMLLLAAYQALLGKWSGGEDLPVATPIAGRGRFETERLIGFFVNTLVLRGDLAGNPSFTALLERIKETALAAFAHQELPFAKLVEALSPERARAHAPLAQVAFVLQNAPRAAPPAGKLRLGRLDVDSGTAKYDLTLGMTETPAGALIAALEFDRALFDPATAARFLGHFHTLLAGIVEGPNCRLAELPWLTAAERRQVLGEWATVSAGDYPRERCVHELVAEQAVRRPEVVALVWDEGSMTYGELAARASRLAHRLRRLGITTETRVGVCLERSPDLVTTLLAVLAAGGAYLPLDPAYPAERLAAMLADGEVSVLVTVERLLASLPPHGARVLCLDREAAELAAESPETPPNLATPESLAYILYTSGSTGRPKGVAVSHRAVVRLVKQSAYADLGKDEVFLQLAPVPFDASTMELWGPLANGGRLVLFPPRLPSLEELGETLVRHRITTLFITSGLFHQMVEAQLPALHRVRQVLTGGDVLSPAHVRRVIDGLAGDAVLVACYGPTENTTYSTSHPLRRGDEVEWTVPIGRPIAHSRVAVLDRTLRPVPVGVAGELYVGGDGLARGYLGRPDLTAERFVPDPLPEEGGGEPGGRLYRTGDLARWRPDGTLDFVGRIDRQVKLRGFRIEPGEIEAALYELPGVGEAVVVVRGEGEEKRLVAYVVPAADAVPPETAALRAALRERLPEYMVPSFFVSLPTLPLDPNGKPDRRALPEPERVAAGEEEAAAPHSPAEELLADLWAEVLRVERVSPDDDFFALGGHSLLATQLVARARRTLGVELPLRALFDAPTPARLAEWIARAAPDPTPPAPPIVPVPRDRELPLSFQQERLWFLDRLGPGSATYTIAAAWSLRGALDAPALAAALGEIVRRHETLRTVFAPGAAGGAVQRVLPPGPVLVPVVDLAALPSSARPGEARALAARHARRPFDLARGPLLRGALLRLEAEDHLLLLAVHHIASDGWSQGLLLAELSALYTAFAAGRPSPLADLPIQYADYAAWQRGWLQGEVLERQLAFWRRTLADAPAVLELPPDRPRPAVQTFRGDRRRVLLPPAFAAELRALSRREGATLFMTLLTAFQVLLGRWSGAEDLSVGTPIAGRTRQEVERLVGLFVNTLVLRADLSGDGRFADLLAQARERALVAYAHQDLPFERLVEALNPERALSHSPLFQVLFVLQNAPREAPPLPGLRFGRMEVEEGVAKFDLTLAAVESAAGLMLHLEFNRDLFDAETAERLLGHLRTLLGGALEDPGRRLSDLPWLTAEERRQLVAWNDTARDFGPATTLHTLIKEQVERTPEAVAVVFEGEGITYRELQRRAGVLARRLRRLGVGPESLVAVAAERSLELVVALLGVLKAGAAYVPIDPSYPAERVSYMLEDSQAGAARPVVLTQERLLERLPLGPLRANGGEVVLLDGEWRESAEVEGDLPVSVDPDHPAYMIYTSGSTGRPKGAVNSHRAIVNRLLWMQEAFGLGPDDRVLQKTPFSFDVSVWEFFWPLLVGARLVVARAWRPSGRPLSGAADPGARAITTLHFVPSMLQVFLEEPEAGGCRNLRRVICSGEALSPELVRRFFERLPEGPELHNLYGPTEAAVDVSWWACTPEDAGHGVPIGRPIANLDVDGRGPRLAAGSGRRAGRAVDRRCRARPRVPQPPGPDGGEVRARSRRAPSRALASIGQATWRGCVRTVRSNTWVGWTIRSSCEASGSSWGRSRRRCALTRRCATPSSSRAARGSDAPASAYVVAQPTASRRPTPCASTCVRACRSTWFPASSSPLPALPLSPNGKVDRKALPDPEAAAPAAGRIAPRTLAEELVAEVWREVLGRESVGIRRQLLRPRRPFPQLVQVQRRLEERTGRELPIVDLFRHPTIAALAEHLVAAGADEPRVAVAQVAPSPAAGESTAIAIVGMAGRFPGAASVDELWRKLCAGEELIRVFGDDELRAAGVDAALLEDPHYVRARGVLDGADLFDAALLRLRAARGADHRPAAAGVPGVLLGGAGGRRLRPRRRSAGRIGVFAGIGESGYVRERLRPPRAGARRRRLPGLAGHQERLPADAGLLQARPQGAERQRPDRLLDLAGGGAPRLPERCWPASATWRWPAASRSPPRSSAATSRRTAHILSPDGHCRAFDAKAAGTVDGERRRRGGAASGLADALADGDRIDAVDPRLGDQQRRRAARWASPRRASTARRR